MGRICLVTTVQYRLNTELEMFDMTTAGNHSDTLIVVFQLQHLFWHVSIGGSVVESSPATRGARVRFPANAFLFYFFVESWRGVFD